MELQLVISAIGVILAVVILIIGLFRGYQTAIVSLIATAIVMITSRLPLMDTIDNVWANGCAGSIVWVFLIFLSGCTLSEVCRKTGSTVALGNALGKLFGPKNAPLAVYIGSVICMFGGLGMGGHLLMFAIGCRLFKQGNYSRTLLPGCIIGSTWTYAICAPYAVDSCNAIPAAAFGTPTNAGLVPGLVGMAVELVLGIAFIMIYSRRQQAKGIVWETELEQAGEEAADDSVSFLSLVKALLPILATFGLYNFAHFSMPVSCFSGGILMMLINLKKYNAKEWMNIWCDGARQGVAPSLDMGAIAGFAAVVTATPFYQSFVGNLQNMNMNPYIFAVLTTGAIAGLTASGTTAVIVTTSSFTQLFQTFAAQGYSLGNLHRLVSFSSTILDSLPTNGCIHSCMEAWNISYKKGYFPIFILTVVISFIGTMVVLACCLLGL